MLRFLMAVHLNYLLAIMIATSGISQEKAKDVPEDTRKTLDIAIQPFSWLDNSQSDTFKSFYKSQAEDLNKFLTGREKPIQSFRNALEKRRNVTSESTPYYFRGFFYYQKHPMDKEFPIFYRKKGRLAANEEVLLDFNKMPKKDIPLSIGPIKIDATGKYLAYAITSESSPHQNIAIFDLQQKKQIHLIENTVGDFVWAQKTPDLFIVSAPKKTSDLPKHVLRLALPNKELLSTYQETKEGFKVTLRKSLSEKYIFIDSIGDVTSETRFVLGLVPSTPPQLLEPKTAGSDYKVKASADKFIMISKAPSDDKQIFVTEANSFKKSDWKPLLPAQLKQPIVDFWGFKDFIVIKTELPSVDKYHLYQYKNKSISSIFEVKAHQSFTMAKNLVFDSDSILYTKESLGSPPEMFNYNVYAKKESRIGSQALLKTVNPSLYTSSLKTFDVKGTKSFVTLTYRKSRKLKSRNPALIVLDDQNPSSYARPRFRDYWLSLMDKGFIVVFPHFKSTDYLTTEASSFQSSIDQVLSLSDQLIAQSFALSGQLYIYSKGSFSPVSATIVNQRPNLYAGLVLDQPRFLASFPGKGDRNQGDFVPPFLEIKNQIYPAMLVVTSKNRLSYQHGDSVKWLAKIKENRSNKEPLFIKNQPQLEKEAILGRSASIEEDTFKFGFFSALAF